MPDPTPDNPQGREFRPAELLWLKHFMAGHTSVDSARLAGIQGESNAVRAWAFRTRKRLQHPVRALLELEGISFPTQVRKLADGLNAMRVTRIVMDEEVVDERVNSDGDPIRVPRTDSDGRPITRKTVQTFHDPDYRTRLEYLRLANQLGGLEAIAKALNYTQTGMSQGGDVPVAAAVDVARVRSYAPEDDDLADLQSADADLLDTPDQEGKTESQARLAVEEAKRRLALLGYDLVKRHAPARGDTPASRPAGGDTP